MLLGDIGYGQVEGALVRPKPTRRPAMRWKSG
jgi:hypothetical protein